MGPMTVREQSLPGRVVVGSNGAYWRDFGTHYSMCPVSEDNDPVEIAAIYVRDRSETTTVLPSDRWTRDGAMVYIDAEGDDAHFIGDAVNEDDAAHFVEWHNALLDTSSDAESLRAPTPRTSAGRRLLGKNAGSDRDPATVEWLANDIWAIETEAMALRQPASSDLRAAVKYDPPSANPAVPLLDTAQPDLRRTPEAEIDVERLAEAIHQSERDLDPQDRPFCPACLKDAQRYVEAYAKLAATPPPAEGRPHLHVGFHLSTCNGEHATPAPAEEE